MIEKARAHHKRNKSDPWHDNLRPVIYPHSRVLMRLVVCIKQRTSNRVHVLLSEKNEVHLPLCEVYPSRNIHSTLRKFMVVRFNFSLYRNSLRSCFQEIFGAHLPKESHKPHGLLNVEHSGDGPDGLLLTVLVTFRVPLEEVYPIDKYSWAMVSRELEDQLKQRIPKNMTVPLRVLR